MRVLDHREYPNIFIGMWWAIQTVTTVGYGDVTPKAVAGRIVAAIVMLEGIAFVAIVTAAVTSTFVARATHLQGVAEAGAGGGTGRGHRVEPRRVERAPRPGRGDVAQPRRTLILGTAAVPTDQRPPRRCRARVRLHAQRGAALARAGASGWTVVSVKNDWATVF